MSIIDYKTFMSDDILTKVDRASMGVSLEAREPLIDHKIVEFMATVPNSIKYKGGVKKYLLKEVLYRYIPRELIERPKSGFQVPLMEWMRGDLREQIDYYISEERLKSSGIYNVDGVMALKRELFMGRDINLSVLWFIFMFEIWRERWFK